MLSTPEFKRWLSMLRRASEADPISGDLLSYVSNNQIQWTAPAAIVDGIEDLTNKDHDLLDGLTDDDHSQYWNDARGNAAIDLHSVTVRKASDEAKTTDTTLADDNTLVVAVEANSNYVIEGAYFHSAGGNNPDIKIAFTVPASATLAIGTIAWQAAVGMKGAIKHTVSGTADTYALTANQYLGMISGTVTIGANAGNVAFQWAQNTSHAEHTTVELGSWLRATKI